MFCHSASATSKARRRVEEGRCGGRARTESSQRRQQRWLACRATEAADSSRRSHSLFLNGPHAHRPHQPTNPQGNSEIHKFQRPISTENPMMALFLLPFCASDMRHYPKKACGWTNNDHQKRRPFVSVLAVLGIRKKQKYCCNVRANVSCGDATLARCVYTVWAAESQRR
jgi:hypothetical protein